MTRARQVTLSVLFVALIGGHVYDIVEVREDWPFSHYPMYSWLTGPTVGRSMLVGVTPRGEVGLRIDEHFHPFDNTRLRGALRQIQRRGGTSEVRDALESLLRRYHRLRDRGAHEGPPLIALRVYRVSWRLKDDAVNRRDPRSRRLRFAARYISPEMQARFRRQREASATRSQADARPPAEGDVVLDPNSADGLEGYAIVSDPAASHATALRVRPPTYRRPPQKPNAYVNLTFEAPAGRYFVWLRGKALEGEHGDSCWLQVDDEIGTRRGKRHRHGLGNWADQFPSDVFAWESRAPGLPPAVVELEDAGSHKLRITTRQAPFLLDQIWLSRTQKLPPTFITPFEAAPLEAAP